MIRLFHVVVPFRVLLLVATEALLIVGAFILTSFLILPVDPTVYLLYDQGVTRILLVAASILLAIHFQDLYSQTRVKSRVMLLQQLLLAVGVAFLLEGMIGYLAPGMELPLSVMAPGAGIALAALFAWRALFSAYEPKVVSRDRVLLVGGGALLAGIGGHIEAHPELGLQTAGYVRGGEEELPGGKTLGPVSDLRGIVETADPHRLVVDMTDPRERASVTDLLTLRFAGYGIEDGASAYEKIRGRVYLGSVQLSDLLHSGDLQPRVQAVAYQRLFDAVLAGAVFTATLPAMALAALAVRLASPGSVLERRGRVGRNGVPFTSYRLRSKSAGTAGKIVRRLRLDVLPELFNVLKGDMALVGPRPSRPEFAAAISRWFPFYRQRQTVRPGMTGWAQIGWDAARDTAAMLEYDLYYIKNISLALNTFILVHTVKSALLSGPEEE